MGLNHSMPGLGRSGRLKPSRRPLSGTPPPPQRKYLRRLELARDQLHHALAPELHRRTHLLRIGRVVVSALGALRGNNLTLLGDVFHYGVPERGVGDPRRRDTLVVHGGRAIAAQIVMNPTGDAGARVEVLLGARPPLKAALAGAEYQRPARTPLLVTAPQDVAHRLRHRNVTRLTGLGALGRKPDHASIEINLIPDQMPDLVAPAQCQHKQSDDAAVIAIV